MSDPTTRLIDTDVPLLLHRRTRIVATLGPATRSPEAIRRMVEAGVDVARLNMSHGTPEEHAERYAGVRAAAAATGRAVAVLVDLSGPKIRTGSFPGGGIDLTDGSTVCVTTRDVPGAVGLIPSNYPALARDVRAGDRILLDDGNLELRVASSDGVDVSCVVVHGGRLKDRKGINLPGVALSTPALTDKDRRDARFAVELGADLLALSFVRSAADVLELRELTTRLGRVVPIIAKIEKPEALADIEAILAAADGIMVARGDLGVELPPEQVPLAQEQLIERARAHAKPVIVATQMLESMVDHARPTRAEVSDVANAVRSGADAVMLSAESAVGAYPYGAVQTMDQVARQTEGYLFERGAFGSLRTRESAGAHHHVTDAISAATAQLSRDLMVRGIVVITRQGHTAAIISASRPAAPTIVASADPAVARAAGLLWGVIPREVDAQAVEDPVALTRRLVLETGLGGAEGDHALLVRGFHPDPALSSPSLTVVRLGSYHS